jgi:preprotein translocase subunit SecA
MHLQFKADAPQPAPEPAVLPPMQAHHINPLTGEDELAQVEAALAAEKAEAEGRSTPKGNGAAREARHEPQKSRKAAAATVNPADPLTWGRVSRNDKCPCGSGKKYKHCHGRH